MSKEKKKRERENNITATETGGNNLNFPPKVNVK
jgi:hypothetical protein